VRCRTLRATSYWATSEVLTACVRRRLSPPASPPWA
jgi:hypothetical protein